MEWPIPKTFPSEVAVWLITYSICICDIVGLNTIRSLHCATLNGLNIASLRFSTPVYTISVSHIDHKFVITRLEGLRLQ